VKQELVKHWMSREIISVTPDTTLPEVHSLMNDYKIRRVPVIKKGELVGIVTIGDVREAEPSAATSLSVWEVNYLVTHLKAKEIMTRNPMAISADATISEAARIMLESKVSGLPVVNGNNSVVGVITESDIFRVVVQEWGRKESAPAAVMSV